MVKPKHLGGDHWQVRVQLGRDEHGKRITRARNFDAVGIRRAERLAREIQAELADAHRASREAPPATLATAAEAWWDLWRQRDRSPSTRHGYRIIIDNHILASPMAAKAVTELTVGEFDRWYLDLAKRVSPTTVQRIDAVVSQVLDQCMRDGTLGRNPARLAHKPEVRSGRRSATHPDQVRAILVAAAEKSPARARALAFAAMTGLRRGELAALRWSRIDLELGVAIIEAAIVTVQARFVDGDVGQGMVTVEKDPKAHQVAAIALGEFATGLARQQMEWQQEVAARSAPGLDADPYLWHVRPPFAKSLFPETFTHWMADARERAGHPSVRLHDLRHYQASQLLEVGATVAEVQERLRHRSIATTLNYLEADHTRQAHLVAMLPPLAIPHRVD